MKKRIEEISSDWGTECSSCKNWHLVNENGNVGVDSSPITYAACCPCFCHENDHRLLIYATGDNEFSPPHRIAFKIVDGNMVSCFLYYNYDRVAYGVNKKLRVVFVVSTDITLIGAP